MSTQPSLSDYAPDPAAQRLAGLVDSQVHYCRQQGDTAFAVLLEVIADRIRALPTAADARARALAAIEQREAVPGDPSSGPYPASVGEVADELAGLVVELDAGPVRGLVRELTSRLGGVGPAEAARQPRDADYHHGLADLCDAASQIAQEPPKPSAGHPHQSGGSEPSSAASAADTASSQTSTPPAQVRVTRYEVSCLPEDHPDRESFTVTVQHRDGDRWAVCWGRLCARRDGDWVDRHGRWDWDVPPSVRTDEWLATHRHDLVHALLIARRVALTLVVNGLTVADVLARDGGS